MTTPADSPRQDDRALLDLARAGDERAFGQLLDHHSDGLRVLCCLMVGDPEMARRMMSDVAVVAWRERSAVERSIDPRTWLYRTALRMCGEAEPSAMSFGDENRLT